MGDGVGKTDMAPAGVRFGLLGPLQVVTHSGATVEIVGRRPRAVLAMLAAAAPSVVSVDLLADATWEGQPPPSAANTLQSYVSRLRSTLKAVGGPPIEWVAGGYRLAVEPGDIDVVRFERLVAAGRAAAGSGDQVLARSLFDEADSLWRGVPLVDIAEAPGVLAQVRGLEEARLSALELRIGADLALGQHGSALPRLQELVAQHPLREGLRAQLALALYRSGRQAESLRCIQAGRELLREELGVDPGPELRQLEQRLLDHDPALSEPTGPAMPARRSGTIAPIVASELPNFPGSMVGRVEELAWLDRAVRGEGQRLVTVRGPGGMGKTRLVVEWLRAVDTTTVPAAFVPLVGITEAEHLPSAIATALGLTLEGEGDPARQVVGALANRTSILVLDNFEQLTAQAAALRWLGDLLAGCPGVQLVVTSRERLGLGSEHVIELEGLSIPDEELIGREAQVAASVAAVELFGRRARQVRANFAIDERNLRSVVEVCRVTDGMPLAIELAATWVRVMSPAEIHDEITRAVDFLTIGSVDAPVRHRSMRAVLEQSWNLLDGSQQQALARLSVFRNGFTRESAREVTGTTLPTLAALVDRSLVRVHDTAGITRYDLHELFRQFAAEQLDAMGLTATVADAHAAHFAAFAEQHHPVLRRAGQVEALARLEREEDNFRAALQQALSSHRFDLAARLGWALWPFWWIKTRQREGRRWLERLLPHLDEVSLRLRTRATMSIEAMAYGQGDVAACRRFARELVRLSDEAGRDPHALAYAHAGFGLVATAEGNLEAALESLQAALPLFEESGEAGMAAQTSTWIGTVHLATGDASTAGQYFEDGLRAGSSIGDRLSISNAHYNLGLLAMTLGDHHAARRHFRAVVPPAEEMDDRGNLVYALEALAVLDGLEGDLSASAVRFGAAEGLLDAIGARGHTYYRPDREWFDSVRATVEADLGSGMFHRLVDEGRRRGLDEMAALARGDDRAVPRSLVTEA